MNMREPVIGHFMRNVCSNLESGKTTRFGPKTLQRVIDEYYLTLTKEIHDTLGSKSVDEFIREAFLGEIMGGLSRMFAASLNTQTTKVVYCMSSLNCLEFSRMLGGFLVEFVNPNPEYGLLGASRAISDFWQITDLELEAFKEARKMYLNLNLQIADLKGVTSHATLLFMMEILKSHGLIPGKDNLEIGLNISNPADVLYVKNGKYLEAGLDFLTIDRRILGCAWLGADTKWNEKVLGENVSLVTEAEVAQMDRYSSLIVKEALHKYNRKLVEYVEVDCELEPDSTDVKIDSERSPPEIDKKAFVFGLDIIIPFAGVIALGALLLLKLTRSAKRPKENTESEFVSNTKQRIEEMLSVSPFNANKRWSLARLMGLYIVDKVILEKGKIVIKFRNRKEFLGFGDLVEFKIQELGIKGSFSYEGNAIILIPQEPVLGLSVINPDRTVNNAVLDKLEVLFASENDFFVQKQAFNFFDNLSRKEGERFAGISNEEKWQRARQLRFKAFVFDIAGTIDSRVVKMLAVLLKKGYPVALISGGEADLDIIVTLENLSGESFRNFSSYTTREKGFTLCKFAFKHNLKIDDIAKFGDEGWGLDINMLIGEGSFSVGKDTFPGSSQIDCFKIFGVHGPDAVIRVLQELESFDGVELGGASQAIRELNSERSPPDQGARGFALGLDIILPFAGVIALGALLFLSPEKALSLLNRIIGSLRLITNGIRSTSSVAGGESDSAAAAFVLILNFVANRIQLLNNIMRPLRQSLSRLVREFDLSVAGGGFLLVAAAACFISPLSLTLESSSNAGAPANRNVSINSVLESLGIKDDLEGEKIFGVKIETFAREHHLFLDMPPYETYDIFEMNDYSRQKDFVVQRSLRYIEEFCLRAARLVNEEQGMRQWIAHLKSRAGKDRKTQKDWLLGRRGPHAQERTDSPVKWALKIYCFKQFRQEKEKKLFAKLGISGMKLKDLPIWPVDEEGRILTGLLDWMTVKNKAPPFAYYEARKQAISQFPQSKPQPAVEQTAIDFEHPQPEQKTGDKGFPQLELPFAEKGFMVDFSLLVFIPILLIVAAAGFVVISLSSSKGIRGTANQIRGIRKCTPLLIKGMDLPFVTYSLRLEGDSDEDVAGKIRVRQRILQEAIKRILESEQTEIRSLLQKIPDLRGILMELETLTLQEMVAREMSARFVFGIVADARINKLQSENLNELANALEQLKEAVILEMAKMNRIKDVESEIRRLRAAMRIVMAPYRRELALFTASQPEQSQNEPENVQVLKILLMITVGYGGHARSDTLIGKIEELIRASVDDQGYGMTAAN
ncbi:MAG: HAD family hydrolase, partial [Candidatus Omnitrophica bacterium]|nr:HAD family hydrolase [Candidatus Omnitrophota bacterium]